jgi:DNA methylase
LNSLPWADNNTLAVVDAYQLLARIPPAAVDLVYLDPQMPPTADAEPEQWQSFISVLQQTRRTLKPTGTLFVHSVPQVRDHIRRLLDQTYGEENLRHEYALPLRAGRWARSTGESLFFYSVGEDFVFNRVTRHIGQEELDRLMYGRDSRGPYRMVGLLSPVARPNRVFEWRGFTPSGKDSWRYSKSELDALFEEGRIRLLVDGGPHRLKQFLREAREIEVGSDWSDMLNDVVTLERVEYPSQKPLAVLERIIRIGAGADAVVLDPYCGSGTTLIAAQSLGKRWIGGDRNPEAISLAKKRLAAVCKLHEPDGYRVYGEAAVLASDPVFPIP